MALANCDSILISIREIIPPTWWDCSGNWLEESLKSSENNVWDSIKLLVIVRCCCLAESKRFLVLVLNLKLANNHGFTLQTTFMWVLSEVVQWRVLRKLFKKRLKPVKEQGIHRVHEVSQAGGWPSFSWHPSHAPSSQWSAWPAAGMNMSHQEQILGSIWVLIHRLVCVPWASVLLS